MLPLAPCFNDGYRSHRHDRAALVFEPLNLHSLMLNRLLQLLILGHLVIVSFLI